MSAERIQAGEISPQRPDRTKHLDEKLEGIDFETLKGILSEILRKSGVDEQRVEKVSKSLFQSSSWFASRYGIGGAANYNIMSDKITVSRATEDLREEHFSTIMFHEIIHAISDNKDGDEYKKSKGDHVIDASRTGLFELEIGTGAFGVSWLPYMERNYEQVNEGMVQLLAEAVTQEYFRRRGKHIDIQKDFNHVYFPGKIAVEILTKYIASKAGVSESVVFDGLVKTVFNNDFSEFLELIKDDENLMLFTKEIKNLNRTAYETADRELELSSVHIPELRPILEKIKIRIQESKKPDAKGDFFNPFIRACHST